ncbi:hypothetical protein [Paenibacillus apiarius]|nr:hypothetical protein [Paenibacillus apiarius]MBN3522698.1 hypothetical protein [Paenibacillus apiarius]
MQMALHLMDPWLIEKSINFRGGFGLHLDKVRCAMELMSEFSASRAWE